MGDSRDYSDKTETTDFSGSSSRSPGSLTWFTGLSNLFDILIEAWPPEIAPGYALHS